MLHGPQDHLLLDCDVLHSRAAFLAAPGPRFRSVRVRDGVGGDSTVGGPYRRMAALKGLPCGEAREEEAEEGVGVGVEADLRVGRSRGVGRIGGAGRSGIGASKTLVV